MILSWLFDTHKTLFSLKQDRKPLWKMTCFAELSVTGDRGLVFFLQDLLIVLHFCETLQNINSRHQFKTSFLQSVWRKGARRWGLECLRNSGNLRVAPLSYYDNGTWLDDRQTMRIRMKSVLYCPVQKSFHCNHLCVLIIFFFFFYWNTGSQVCCRCFLLVIH